ncbi:hypothetical protein PAXRUDRAFT_36522 [Paxillus rubicundulus Ve08.2h10]|uniref:Uncharacterized protein n=1 Tax=Paxillus rubicundulus Ve08.2h10 TaxID=930991 RepID=A0A0D0DL68_9AGAM|nr:hypothetical protein PAXRUDRAFT_36522 [Paxillus rubicundulus Ve08.2h10]
MWEVQCPHEQCNTWVKTSIKTSIPLSIPGHFTNLEAHIGLKACIEISSSSTLVSVHSEISSPASVLAPIHADMLFSCPGLVIDETNWPVSPDLPVEIHFPWLHMCQGDGTSCIPCRSLLPKVKAAAVNATEHKAHTCRRVRTQETTTESTEEE